MTNHSVTNENDAVSTRYSDIILLNSMFSYFRLLSWFIIVKIKFLRAWIAGGNSLEVDDRRR